MLLFIVWAKWEGSHCVTMDISSECVRVFGLTYTHRDVHLQGSFCNCDEALHFIESNQPNTLYCQK